MEADFVNKFIQKQSQLLSELTNKNLMVETKLELLEVKYNELLTQYNLLAESVERARLAAEQRAREQATALQEASEKSKPPKKHTKEVIQPSVTDFVEETSTESQF